MNQLRVRYAETDKMGVVYYANYLVWFEIGRVEYLRSLGFDYRSMELDDGCILPVVEASCRYRAPARYDDRIEIEADPVLLRGSVLKFAYKIYRVDELEPSSGGADRGNPRTLLAEGETVHVVCDANMQKRDLPARYAESIRKAIPDKRRSQI